MVRHADGVVTTNGSRARILTERYGRTGIDVLQNVPLPVEHVVPLDPGFPPGVPVLLYQGGIYARGRAFRQTIEALRLLDGVHFAILGFGRDADLALVREWSEEAGVAAGSSARPGMAASASRMPAARAYRSMEGRESLFAGNENMAELLLVMTAPPCAWRRLPSSG